MKYKNKVVLDWVGKEQDANMIMSQEKRPLMSERVYPHLSSDGYVDFGTIMPIKDIPKGRLIKGTNLEVMQALIDTGYAGKFDLIYLDPPYFSASNYHSVLKVGAKDNSEIIKRSVFTDTWRDLGEYLDYILAILKLSHKLLSHQGSLFVHLDWHASHYVKILLDEVFAMDNFINEIIWCYSGGSNAKRHLHKKHDTIFWYGKSKDYIFNPQYRPYTAKTKERGLTKVKGNKYVLREHGAMLQDWWIDINKILSPTAYENLKFPTQKPIALMERIIKMASYEESLVGDFFLGSGTSAEAAELLNRNWIGCDNSNIALQTTQLRLLKCQARPYQIDRLDSTNYLSPEMSIIFKLQEDTIFINLGIAMEETAHQVAFWEIGFYEQDIFNSCWQMINHNRQNGQLPVEVAIKGFPKNAVKLAVKIHDFYGNTFMQTQA